MSISIKNIQVTIGGTQSNMFKIQLDGAKYRLDSFTLSQNLLQPNVLSFVMYKDPEEDVNEPQFASARLLLVRQLASSCRQTRWSKKSHRSPMKGKWQTSNLRA